jgi:flagellar basal-body rod modification protein FlgD
MQVTQTTNTSGGQVAVSTAGSLGAKPLVSADAFMQLLVAQLKYQDPTKPVDSTQYVSQLASLSNLQQSVQQTGALQNVLAASSTTEAASLIGLHAASADGSVKGVVTSTKIDPSGVTVVLDNGQQLSVGSGVTLSSQ